MQSPQSSPRPSPPPCSSPPAAPPNWSVASLGHQLRRRRRQPADPVQLCCGRQPARAVTAQASSRRHQALIAATVVNIDALEQPPPSAASSRTGQRASRSPATVMIEMKFRNNVYMAARATRAS